MTTYQAADLVLFRGSSLFDRIIRLGQWLNPATRAACRYTHVALLTGTSDELVEAVSTGVRLSRLSNATQPYTIVHVTASAEDRAAAISYARARLSERYGRLQIVGVLLSLLTGGRLTFGENHTVICSQLAGEAEARCGVDFGTDTEDLTPAMIAAHYGVRS